MPEEKKGANGLESPPNDKGANQDGKTPPVEELQAENRRKADEIKSLKESQANYEKRITELEEKHRLTAKERDELKALRAKSEHATEDMDTLIEQLEAQAKAGDRNAQVWLAALDKKARKIAEDTVKDVLSKQQLADDFEVQEAFLEDKAKEQGMTVAELRKAIDSYAEPYMGKKPSTQAKNAFRDWKKNKDLDDREKKLKEREDKDREYREGGVNPSHAEESGKLKSKWEGAKTRDEKLATLHDI